MHHAKKIINHNSFMLTIAGNDIFIIIFKA